MVEIVSPPATLSVLLGGLKTAARRPGAAPNLPTVKLARPPVTILASDVDRYNRVCGFDAGVGVPPTYVHILAFPLHMALMLRKDFPFPMAGIVHIANRIQQHRPVVGGERLTIEAQCGRLMTHPRGQAFAIDVTAKRPDGLVWEGSSIYLHRSRRPARGPAVPAPLDPPTDEAVLWSGRVGRSMGGRYAKVSGDRNPIHTSRIGARLFGFKTPIAHGMWSLARALASVLPDRPIAAVTIDASFRAPLPLGRSIDVRGGTERFALTSRDGERIHLVGTLSDLT